MKKIKVVCVVGPTASGKSELAVKLAKKYNGEIISCDSRQIYKGFDISSGKVEGQWLSITETGSNKSIYKNKPVDKKFVYKSIPHYLIDEANPRVQYSVSRFQKKARKLIREISSRGKLPILCGGTGYWLDAVVFSQSIPKVKPDLALRKKLSKLTTQSLFKRLQKLDHTRASKIDTKNPHRLIRALEIVLTTGKPVPESITRNLYDTVWLGINPGMDMLEKKIRTRLTQRLKQGMIAEVEKLHHQQKLSWQKLESFGLEYKYCALFLQDKLGLEEMENLLYIAIRQYAKRQLTWWKRNKAINWEAGPHQLMTLAKNLLK